MLLSIFEQIEIEIPLWFEDYMGCFFFFFSCFLLLLRNMAKSKLSMYYMMFSDRDFVVW